METITFNDKEYKVREIELPKFGSVVISTTTLNSNLMNENGSYVSMEAAFIDEQIFYFIDENKIQLSEQKLRDLLIEEIK